MENFNILLPLAGITQDSIVDGPGIRFTLFFQGCPHHCPGCHNPETHPLKGGEKVKISSVLEQIGSNPLLDGVTFSGGEPFIHLTALWHIIQQIRLTFPNLNLGAYSGYTYEQLTVNQNPLVKQILYQLDFLVDGPFILAQKTELPYRGSQNQRFLKLFKGDILN